MQWHSVSQPIFQRQSDQLYLGSSPVPSVSEQHFPSNPHHLLSVSAPSSQQRPFPWLPLCEQDSEPRLFKLLLLSLAAFSVGGQMPPRGRRTDVAYVMISKISCLSGPNPANIPPYILPPYGRLVRLRQALLCRGRPESSRHVAPSQHWLEKSESMSSAGRDFTVPLEGNYQHLSVMGTIRPQDDSSGFNRQQSNMRK